MDALISGSYLPRPSVTEQERYVNDTRSFRALISAIQFPNLNSDRFGTKNRAGTKIIFRVQVIFARLIDDANLMESGRCFVWDDLINLAQLQRCRVALVPYADDELGFAFHVS